jgi:hypothetical protein
MTIRAPLYVSMSHVFPRFFLIYTLLPLATSTIFTLFITQNQFMVSCKFSESLIVVMIWNVIDVIVYRRMLFTGCEVRIGTIVSEVLMDCVGATMLGPCEKPFILKHFFMGV